MRMVPLAAACAVCVAACSSPTAVAAPAEPTFLALYIGDLLVSRTSSLGMLPGDSLNFAVRLTDAAGHPVSGLHPRILSRNPAAISVDSLGEARVVGKGSAWIVGSLLTPARNVLADSTFVGVFCTIGSLPAVKLTVVDSLTGQSGPMHSLKIVIHDGAARDTAFVPSIAAGAPLFTFGMANERMGTYTLDVTADGYLPWQKTGIAVTADPCHVKTVLVTARLQLSP